MAARSMGRRIKPGGGYELFMWYFMRLSGLALVFLAVGHLFIMHILNNVETINYAFVAGRWTAPRTGWIWRLWDASLISLAVIHGFNGLREVLYEYLGSGARVFAGTLTWALTFLFIGAGGYSILMFQPDEAHIKAHPLKIERTTEPPVVSSPPITPPLGGPDERGSGTLNSRVPDPLSSGPLRVSVR